MSGSQFVRSGPDRPGFYRVYFTQNDNQPPQSFDELIVQEASNIC